MITPTLYYEYGKTKKQFVSTWKTDNLSTGSSTATQVKLPLVSTGTYNMTVDWGDGNTSLITVWNQATVTHNYSIAGTYTITIKGRCDGWQFNNTGDRLKILTITEWGVLRINSTNVAHFLGCANLTLGTVKDIIDLSLCTNISQIFEGCTALTTINRVNEWITTNITVYSSAFRSTPFNSNIGNWNVSNGLFFNSMFRSNTSFNNGGSSSINNWVFKTTGSIDIQSIFLGAIAFNQPIGNWNTIAFSNANSSFSGATAFNQNIGTWDIRNVTSFTNFMAGKTPATFSTANLDAIYNGWSALPSVKPSIVITFGTAKRTAASTAGRAILTGAPNNWAITDGGI